MAHDAYVRFEGIEARSGAHGDMAGWARLWSFRHSIVQPAAGSAAATGDAGPGRADHGDFVLLKEIDEASPRLAFYCCAGQRIPQVIVAIHNSINFRMKYMEYRLQQVTVRGIAPYLPEAGNNLAGAGARVVREEVALRYRSITWTYTMLDEDRARGNISCGWDLAQNRGL